MSNSDLVATNSGLVVMNSGWVVMNSGWVVMNSGWVVKSSDRAATNSDLAGLNFAPVVDYYLALSCFELVVDCFLVSNFGLRVDYHLGSSFELLVGYHLVMSCFESGVVLHRYLDQTEPLKWNYRFVVFLDPASRFPYVMPYRLLS